MASEVITPGEAKRRFGLELEKLASKFGLRSPRTMWLSRSVPDGEQVLKFGGNVRDGRLFLSATACVRFPAIQHVLGSGSDEEVPTILVPTHLLRDDRRFFEWELDLAAPDFSGIVADVAAEIELRVLPFFEMYCSVESVRDSLGSDDPDAWFSLSPVQRISVLAAALAIENRSEAATQLLSQKLDEGLPPRQAGKVQALLTRLKKLELGG